MFSFSYGAYVGPNGCTFKPVSRQHKAVRINSFVVAHTVSLMVEGQFLGTIPDDNRAFAVALANALTVPRQAGGFLWWNGSGWDNTAYWLPVDSTLLEGPYVIDSTLEAGDLTHVVDQKFSFTIEATYANTQEGRTVVEFNERLEYTGDGGAVWVLAPQATARSIYQKIADYSDCFLTQSGIVVSRGSVLPSLPLPIIITSGAQIAPQSRMVRTYKQLGTGILVSETQYSYSFQLPDFPSGLTPGYLI